MQERKKTFSKLWYVPSTFEHLISQNS